MCQVGRNKCSSIYSYNSATCEWCCVILYSDLAVVGITVWVYNAVFVVYVHIIVEYLDQLIRASFHAVHRTLRVIRPFNVVLIFMLAAWRQYKYTSSYLLLLNLVVLLRKHALSTLQIRYVVVVELGLVPLSDEHAVRYPQNHYSCLWTNVTITVDLPNTWANSCRVSVNSPRQGHRWNRRCKHSFFCLFIRVESQTAASEDRDSRGERSDDAQPINVTPLARDVTESGFNS